MDLHFEMFTITVEPFKGDMERNRVAAMKLAMKLNAKIKFTREGKTFIIDPYGKIIDE